MNYKRKEFWIPTAIGLVLILLVSGILIYRNFIRPEEWRLYDQVKSKPKWVEWVYVKMGWNLKKSKIDALRKLSKLKTKLAVKVFIKCMSDEDELVRTSAINTTYGLAQIGDKFAIEPLIECLSNRDATVRMLAALSLMKLGDQSAVKPLIKCYKREEIQRVRETVSIALKKLGHPVISANTKP